MLVLTRKRAEMIQIGDNIVIKVIKTGNGSVKLGIEAPAHVRVLRAELCEEPASVVTAPMQVVDVPNWATSDQFPQPHVA